MPGLRTVGQPAMKPEEAAAWEAWQRSLSALGFRPDGWFSLDDFDEMHVSAWRHEDRPVAAFLLFAPAAGTFRLRFISKRAGETVLVSSTRVTELSYPPPSGVYLQVRRAATA